MLDHILDQRILHVGRIRNDDALIAVTRLKADGLIVEHRETDLTLSTYYFYTVLAGTLVSHIAPRARAWQTILETEAGTHGVLCLVKSAPAGANASRLKDDTKHILQQIELMRGHVIEIAAAGNLRLQAPGEGVPPYRWPPDQ